ncbi:MAG TPA: hypothetical protein VJ873_07575, partial [bacterium]|nr:hypothetical protein [bacterium]
MGLWERKVLAGWAAGLALFLSAGWFGWDWNHRMAAASLGLTQGYRLNEKLSSLLADVSDAGDTLKDYLSTRSKASRGAFANGVYSAREKVKSLRKEPGWNPAQQSKLDQLDFQLNAELDALKPAAPAFPPKGRKGKVPSISLKPADLKAIHKTRRVVAGLQAEVAGLIL